ncbi:hypothetical protein TeGR_g13332 [Tetraparma gracilis]|uniref:EF-hand domain-containing protein n=1 Tax=Tetraparma gracilis TaxID=2962635 RepID=A0ABQ6N5L7_9STRA|nr:hypothetical protein TeGR_g13332 [Tetraparma gracilis]
MPINKKQQFKDMAHAPTNKSRHNVVNLLNNDREAIAAGATKKKNKAKSKFAGGVHEASGKAVGQAGAATGVRGLRKTANIAKAKKERLKQEEEDAQAAHEEGKQEQGGEGDGGGKKRRKSGRVQELEEKENADEAQAALEEHKEEIARMKQKSASGPKKPFSCWRCFKKWFPLCILLSCCGALWKQLRTSVGFLHAWVQWEFFGKVTHAVNREQYLLEKYMDQRGELIACFQTLKLTDEERVRWVEMWSMIDADEDNTMDEKEFRDFFQFANPEVKDLVCTKRLFQLFNRNFNGFVNIRDFIITTWQYCPFDSQRVAEFAFRLLSRRGDVFDPDVTIIDLVDIEEFVRNRYDPMKRKKANALKKTAVAIFTFMDVDGSGGVGFDEFVVFCSQNPVFLYYAHWYQAAMRAVVFGEQYWRDATNDRSDVLHRDIMQEAMLRDNLDAQIPSLGVLGPELQKKRGNKFKVDFPEAWYKEKEAAFMAKQELKDRQDLAQDMAKQTYARMSRIFVRMIPDAIGLRPAFSIWKDWVEYDKSLHEDGGESYAMSHMSLMDVKEAVKAKSLGMTTAKLEASRKFTKEEMGVEETMHDQVLRESALGAPVDDDVVAEHMRQYEMKLDAQTGSVNKAQRIKESMSYENYTSPTKLKSLRELDSLGNRGMYDLLRDDDEDVAMIQMEFGLGGEDGEDGEGEGGGGGGGGVGGLGRGGSLSPSNMDRMRSGTFGFGDDEEKKGGDESFSFNDFGIDLDEMV